ncbi:MAG TPA: GNAT family N-acetyltransferase, partial [Gemmatimonadales bacterium]|nr:GNAT family N-acetyltransferase [Gemmatimonadales bacterium]
GLGTEVAGACLDVGRSRLGLRSLVAITLRSNIASQRVLLKSGLVYEREVTHEGLLHLLFRARPL